MGKSRANRTHFPFTRPHPARPNRQRTLLKSGVVVRSKLERVCEQSWNGDRDGTVILEEWYC